ncbi:MAG TPA: cadherin-like beta sandwich domain-containing protein [Pseudomonadales bacterium]|nr:cadherin-like beta sandwich domain-containing protein [Pseudomonadales bacterium]
MRGSCRDSSGGSLSALLGAVVLLLLSACGGGGGGGGGGADPASDARLTALTLSDGMLVPAFAARTLAYSAEVPNATASLTVTATAAQASATIDVNGAAVSSGTPSPALALVVGDNPVTIRVTAPDGVRQRTYSLVVTRRPPPSSNAALVSLTLDVSPLDQIFVGNQLNYTASVGFLAASTRIVAVPENDRATLDLRGEPLAAGVPSASVPLAVGDTAIDLEVTAEDGIAMRTYSVQVTRAAAATLAQEAYLKASNTGPDRFGAALALSGSTLAVGAPDESSAAAGIDGDENDDSLATAGAVYLFDRPDTTWLRVAYVKASNPGGPDRFGTALAMAGDLLAVGAPGEQSLATGVGGSQQDDSGSAAGAVYLFRRDEAGDWSQEAYAKAPNTDSGDSFGAAVAVDGARLLVGADGEDGAVAGVDGNAADNSLSNAGAAYLFERDGTVGWRASAYLKASDVDSADRFGRSVAISGDLIAVGAPLEDSSAKGVDGNDADDSLSSSGAVYVFGVDAAGSWRQVAYLKASNPDAGDRFGTAVALDGELLAVAADGEDSAARGVDGDQNDDSLDAAGAVYLFERDASGRWSQTAYLKASNPDSLDGFGTALILRGNLLAVGARDEDSRATGIGGDQSDDGARDAGAVYVFARDAAGAWSQIAYVKASNTDPSDGFGSSLALDGDTLVAGAPGEDSAARGVGGNQADDSLAGAGAAYVIR